MSSHIGSAEGAIRVRARSSLVKWIRSIRFPRRGAGRLGSQRYIGDAAGSWAFNSWLKEVAIDLRKGDPDGGPKVDAGRAHKYQDEVRDVSTRVVMSRRGLLTAGALMGAGMVAGADRVFADAGLGQRIDARWVRQAKSNWCGPAVAEIVLSACRSGSPTQYQLHGIADNDGGTNRWEMRATLNSYTPYYDYTVYEGLSRPLTGSQQNAFFDRVRSDIGNGFAMATGILVRKGYPRFNSYPNREIDHWIAVTGWTTNFQGKRAVYVLDPVAGRPGFGRSVRGAWVWVEFLGRFVKSYTA